MIIKYKGKKLIKNKRGGGVHGAGLTIPRPRTKATSFPPTPNQISFFPVKYGAGRSGLSEGGFKCHV